VAALESRSGKIATNMRKDAGKPVDVCTC